MAQASPATAPALLRARIFGLTWLSYFSYYFTRKNYSVIKSSLGLDKSQLSMIETVYLSAYAFGQFTNGLLADVIGPRRLVAAGMMLSAAMSILFGFGSALPIFLVAYGLNGFFQSSGWPGNGKAMASWFSTLLTARSTLDVMVVVILRSRLMTTPSVAD